MLDHTQRPAPGFNAADLWERQGITTHLGGIRATHRLAERCGIRPGQRVLNIGCGTGYSACLLARDYGAHVIAADISPAVLEHARARVAKQGLQEKVGTVRADIHALDFPAGAFDAVFVESVLVFCDKTRAAAEVFRVLKPGGVFGDNELSFLQPPSERWKSLFTSDALGIHLDPLDAEAWKGMFGAAGFVELSAEVNPLRMREQVASHIRAEGWRKYLTTVVRELVRPDVRAVFFNRDMLRAWREFPAYIGYGLYVSRKP